MGARGDGKTQFLVHAIRALHGRAPALPAAEDALNRAVMRLVLDPRAPRPDATPPGVLPHFTFRARLQTLFAQLGVRGAWLLASRIGRVRGLLVVAYLLVVGGAAAAIAVDVSRGLLAAGAGAALAAIGTLVARRRIARAGEVEIVFWDVAGEQVYSETAADYHALLGELVAERRRRCEELGRAYAFAPVLICNPLALGTLDGAPPYARLRELLPLFAAIDRDATTRARRDQPLVGRRSDLRARRAARRGRARHDARARRAGPAGAARRARARARALPRRRGRPRRPRHGPLPALRHRAPLRGQRRRRRRRRGEPALRYEYDDGPGTFSGDARKRFLDWLVAVPKWRPMRRRRAASASEREREREASAPEPALVADVWARRG